jgi:two-component system cell cycle sensor histidine kinase PleC
MAAVRNPPRRRTTVARVAAAGEVASIQDYGLVFGLDPATLTIVHASANTETLLGVAAPALIGTPFARVVDTGYAEALAEFVKQPSSEAGPFGPVTVRAKTADDTWHAASHRAGNAIVVEAVPSRAPAPTLDSFVLDGTVALRAIGENTGLGATAAAIVRHLRGITEYDRVLVVRFDAGGNGEVIAENKSAAAGPSLAGFRFRADEMPAAARAVALRNPMRMVVDLAASPVPVLSARPDTPPLDLSGAILRAPPSAHVKFLARLGARGALLMTLVHAKRMWGLVAFLHREPRRMPLPHRAILQLMSDSIAVRLAGAEEIERERELARKSRALEGFRRALEREQGDSAAAMLRRHGKALLRVLEADGLWCHLPEADIAIGENPTPEIVRRVAALCRVRSGSGVFATENLAALDPALGQAAGDAARGALFALLPRSRGTLLFLRGEAKRQGAADTGRKTFAAERAEAWRQENEGRSVPWSAADLAIAPGAAEAVDALAPRLVERRNMRRVFENEAKLRAILEATQDGLIVLDAKGGVLDFSSGAERLFGWAAAEIVGKPAELLVPEAGREAHRRAVVEAGRGLGPRVVGADGGLVAQRKDGSMFPVEMTFTSIVLGGEHMFVAALRDIGERLSLAQRDRFWFEHSTIGYSVSDPFSQRRLRVNPALCAMLGYTEAELLGMPVLATTQDDDARPALAWREHLRTGSDAPLRRVQRLVRKDGKLVYARVTAMPMRYPGSETIHVVAEIVDVTELMEAEVKLRAALARAEAANATKAQFLATMSHELRTPLNAIIGMSEMIVAGVMGPIGNPRYAEYVGDIHKAGKHLLDLVTDVLDASRIESGGYRLSPGPLAVDDVIEEACRMVAPLAAARNIVFERRVAGDLPAIRADRRALKQVLINVISNAVRFTPEKGLIAVRARGAQPGGIEVTVADTGSGIAPEHLPHVTEPFYRAGDAYTASASANAASGAGLGLAIANGIVAAHGGSLEIASQLGHGTTVTIKLPPPTQVLASPA